MLDTFPAAEKAHVGEADKLAHPLLMHVAEDDEFVPKEAQQIILAAF